MASPTAPRPTLALRGALTAPTTVRGLLALLAALLLLVVAVPLSGPARADEADADFDSWSALAQSVCAQLDSAEGLYQAGNPTGAAAAIRSAASSGYTASNLGTVTKDTLGAETATSQLAAFEELRKSAQTTGNETALATGVDALQASLTQSAATLDATADLPDPRTYQAQLSAKVASDRATLQANRSGTNTGRGSRTWSQVAAEMVTYIDSGVAKAKAGDGEAGADDVNTAYYSYYEKLGYEKTVMTAISGDRVSQVEHLFKELRKAMRADKDITAIEADAHTLKDYLITDAAFLDGGTAQVNPVKAFFTGSFGQAFLILLREGLEAILVVAAVIAYLVKAGMKDRVKVIYAGLVLGLLASGVFAVLFAVLYDSASSHQEVLEGVVALIAMVMLLFTSNWMLSKSSVSSWNRYIKDRTEASISTGGFWALASLSFLAVFREGAETVMFYEALLAMDSSGGTSVWQGFAAGVVVLVIIFLLIRFTSVRIPLRPFFAVTSFVMAVLVVVFAGGGVHALLEGDVVPATYLEGVPTYDYLGLYPYVETLTAQGVMLVIVLVLSGLSLYRHHRADKDAGKGKDSSQPVTADADTPAVTA